VLTVTADRLRTIGHRIFTSAGTPSDIANHVVDSLVETTLLGHDSHGVIRIPSYVAAIKQGQLLPAAQPAITRETATTALVDGNLAFGQIAATFATDLAIAKARAAHLAAASILRCNHIGRLGEYAERAARAGMLSMIVFGAFGAGGAAPFGGAGRVLGTNPFAFGVPSSGSHGPMIADFATTTVAEGKLRVARAKKKPVPQGWIVDKQGNPTTNVEDYYSGGSLLPFGGHKGYALSMVAAALGGSLATGGIPGPDLPGVRGTFVLVINPEGFRPFQEFAASADALFETVKAAPPASGSSEVLIPGEPERRERAKRLAEGVPVPEETWNQLEVVAAELGVSSTCMFAL
jgi:LDH2 family malate/lactate/ureidoglycolate dehydrogenase